MVVVIDVVLGATISLSRKPAPTDSRQKRKSRYIILESFHGEIMYEPNEI